MQFRAFVCPLEHPHTPPELLEAKDVGSWRYEDVPQHLVGCFGLRWRILDTPIRLQRLPDSAGNSLMISDSVELEGSCRAQKNQKSSQDSAHRNLQVQIQDKKSNEQKLETWLQQGFSTMSAEGFSLQNASS